MNEIMDEINNTIGDETRLTPIERVVKWGCTMSMVIKMNEKPSAEGRKWLTDNFDKAVIELITECRKKK